MTINLNNDYAEPEYWNIEKTWTIHFENGYYFVLDKGLDQKEFLKEIKPKYNKEKIKLKDLIPDDK